MGFETLPTAIMGGAIGGGSFTTRVHLLTTDIRYGKLGQINQLFALGITYGSLRYWLHVQRVRSQHIDWANAVHAADAVANRNATDLNTRLDRVWHDNRFDGEVQNFLGAGIAFVAAGAAIGSIIPGVGTLVGAVAGAIVGVIYVVIPFGKWDMYRDFSKYADALTLEERFIHFRMFRTLSDRACERDGHDHFPPWQLDEKTAWDELRNSNFDTVFQLFKILWLKDSIPQDPTLVNWALACATMETQNDQEKLSDQGCYQWIVNDGRGSQWLKPAFEANKDKTCAELRAGAGMNDFVDYPVPDWVAARLSGDQSA